MLLLFDGSRDLFLVLSAKVEGHHTRHDDHDVIGSDVTAQREDCEHENHGERNNRLDLDQIREILDEFHGNSSLRGFVKTFEIVDPMILDLDLFLVDRYALFECIHTLDDVVVLIDFLLELLESILSQLTGDDYADQRAEETPDHTDQRDYNGFGHWAHSSNLAYLPETHAF